MASSPPVLVARFASRPELAPILRAAIDSDIVYIALPAPPPPGRHMLQLWVGPGLIAAVSAELVGSGRQGGEYPLRLRPLDPTHGPELESILQRRSMMPAAPEASPHATRSSQNMRAVRPSTSGMSAVPSATPTQQSPAPALPRPPSMAPTLDEDAIVAPKASPPPPLVVPQTPSAEMRTVVFDPDAVMRRPSTAPVEDEQTLPRSERAVKIAASRRRSADFDMPVSEESHTLPRSDRSPPVEHAASWNVRIAETTKDPLCGRTIGGKYVLESVIGQGAIGIVFKGTHRDLGRTVAIKVLNPRWRDDPDLLAVFKSEARAASLLEHANVARLYDYGQEEDGLVYIVMEYLSGYTLGSVLDARRKLTVARAVDLMLQICSGLSAAHDRGIVHRDVKPDNIVLVPVQDDEGQPVETVKVCDFGIAALGTAREGGGNTTGGTPEYMSPEQARGGPVTPAADVYACGVVLYEMLTGQVPFTDDQAYRILMKHASEAPTPPSDRVPGVPATLEAIVMRALSKSPERRYQNAREMRVELRKAL